MLLNYSIDGYENIQHQDYYALQTIVNNLTSLYRHYGYHQISTPTFESYDLYVNENSIPSDDLFKLVNHQGKVLALKPDATLPITRMAAMNHPNSNEIIKFAYHTNIYRNFSSPEIIRKEINQIGIEYFGNNTPECDGEIIGLAILSLLQNGINDVHIDLGHVGFINFLFEELKLSSIEKETLFKYIENKNIGDIESYLDTLTLNTNQKEIIFKLPMLYGKPQTVLSKMKTLCLNAKMEGVIEEISAIYDHLKVMNLEQYISFDLGFTNQMNYYSDINFKGYINNWGEPVISGGRYNNLSEKFGVSRPACGFALDIMKIVDYMETKTLLKKDTQTKYVIIYNTMDKVNAYAVANDLRNKNEIAEVFLLKDDIKTDLLLLKNNPLFNTAKLYFLSHGKLNYYNNDSFEVIDSIKIEKEVK
jgi:ATP phosphoribosyltransferase regulatory subunit